MKAKKNKKKEYQKETILFMWFWIFIVVVGIVSHLIDVAFGESFNVMFTLTSAVYLLFFGLGLYFAKKGKRIAAVFELLAGSVIVLNDFFPDKGLGLYGIIGILVVLHAIIYLFLHRKDK